MERRPDYPPTLLLVDDEPEILVALTDLFEEEFRIVTAGSGEAALAMLPGQPAVEIIVSDQRMPGMTGDAFLARARKICQAEAVLLTGYADLEAVIAAVNHGGIAGYAPKPWEPAALLSMVRGAGARFRLNRALETEQALLRGMMDSSHDAVSFRDTGGRYVRMNAAKAAALGGTPQDWIGCELPLSSEDADAIASATMRETLEARSEEGGLPRWMRQTRIPIRNESGKVSYLALIERDITEERLLQERLHQAEKMQALGTMAGGVAHDFNNLLTAILGSLELLDASLPVDARQRRMIGNAMAAAERGSALTRRLLSFSRKRPLQLAPTDVNRLVAEMEDLVLRSVGDDVALEQRLQPGAWTAMVDPEQLSMALLNLCINSRDAMPDGGKIILSTRNVSVEEGTIGDLMPGDYVGIAVADTGSGMPQAVLAQAFEPFFTTKEVGRGTGLGLSMVYGLSRQSGGTTLIESSEGQGTKVEVLLPRLFEPPSPPQRPEQSANASGTARVLIVDDDAAVRQVTAGFLAELGQDAIEAADGSDALHLLRTDATIGMLVTDVRMPKMTGWELVEQAQQIRPGLPILMVSGFPPTDDAARSLPLLRKPFRKAELAEQLALLLSSRMM
ncbi:response regulator [Pseudoroseomonas globiformis]|uniref:histidine kinase n=1 Tax=Teichococcus globiformis TaxID=2307229 RepID=A0ABV7G969_9PROT